MPCGGCSEGEVLQRLPLVDHIAVHTEVLDNVLHNLLHKILVLLSFQLRPAARPLGIFVLRRCKLQAHVLGHVLAVQSEVLSQSLDDLLHRIGFSFRFD